MEIDLTYDLSVDDAPAGFKTALAYAAQYLDHLITDNITVNINVGWGEIDGDPIAGDVSEGGPSAGIDLSYSQLVAQLSANANSPADEDALANLPATDPTDGGQFFIANAQLKAWGLLAANGSENDGSVGFGDNNPYNFSTNGSIGPDQLDFVGVAEHELTHAMGRIAGLQYEPNTYTLQDLFRYSAPGKLELQGGVPAYFSIDGGQTNLDNFDTTSDPGDWTSSAGNDAFDAFSNLGVENIITPTDITEMNVLGFSVACFAAGTRIATARGSVPVQTLRAGDLAITARGEAVPVVWLGTRRLDCRRHPRPPDVWPVRIIADAFGAGLPGRDLLLSPDHAVFVDGVLIPIRHLVNGASVVQERCDAIEYWHVELLRHDVLLAEGLPAESYLDTGNRGSFAGAATIALHPDFARRTWQRDGCAELVADGPRVAAVRRRLLRHARRLGFATTRDPALALLVHDRAVAVRRDGARYVVGLSGSVELVRLRSRTWTPAHTETNAEDRRVLGVAVGRVWLDGREASLASTALAEGWHGPEPCLRWTTGDALLPVAGVRQVAFELAMTGRYWIGRRAEAARAVSRRSGP